MTTVESRQSDAEQRFWALATDVGARSANPWVSYERLKRQFASAFPNASDHERRAAESRLRYLLGV